MPVGGDEFKKICVPSFRYFIDNMLLLFLITAAESKSPEIGTPLSLHYGIGVPESVTNAFLYGNKM